MFKFVMVIILAAIGAFFATYYISETTTYISETATFDKRGIVKQITIEATSTPVIAEIPELPDDVVIVEEKIEEIIVIETAAEQIPAEEDFNIRIPNKDIYTLSAKKVVNLLCDAGKNTYTVATGLMIDERGVILSNAHIADDLPADPTCNIRTGSPAINFATAKLIFKSTLYRIAETDAEKAIHDISLWQIQDPEEAYAFWVMDTNTQSRETENLLSMSYPAELLGGENIFNNLHLLFSNTVVTVTDGYIIQSDASISSQFGSSGGVLIDPYSAKMRGLIFGIDFTDSDLLTERKLFSITPLAINQSIQKETGQNLASFINSFFD